DQVALGSLLKLLRNLKGMALIEQGFPAVEPTRERSRPLLFEQARRRYEMRFGMIPVEDLMAASKMEGRLIPDPIGAVAQHDGILGLFPPTAPRQRPGLLA